MKRPIVIAAIGYIIGILEGLYLKISIVPFYILIVAIYLIIKNIPRKKRLLIWDFSRYVRYLKIYINKKSIIIFVIASLISNISILHAEKQYSTMQNQLQEKGKIQIEGMIVSNAKERDYDIEYKLKNSKNYYFYIHTKKSDKLEYGQNVKIVGNFEMPETQRNEGGFNYQEYLKEQKNLGIIKVEKITNINKTPGIIEKIFIEANKISTMLKNKIKETISDENVSSILIALTLGDNDYIPDDILNKFRETNMAHILAVSGMHISYLILASISVSKRIIGIRNSYYITIIVLILYMFLAGFSPSIVRATIMGILSIIANIIYRQDDGLTSMGIAMLIILSNNIYTIFDIGFQLSFSGTLAMQAFKEKAKVKQIVSIFLIQIFVLPISIYHFNIFCPYFILSNLIISFIIGPIMICSFLFVIFISISAKLATTFSILPIIAIKILLLVFEISKFPFSKIYVATPKVWQIVVYFLILIIFYFIYQIYFSKKETLTKKRFYQMSKAYKFYFLYRKGVKPKKILAISSILIIFSTTLIWQFSCDLQIHFVDVGQGDCTFIETPKGKTILIDGGSNSVLPYILDKGYTKIDTVMISHFDSDHVNGILDVMNNLKINKAIIGKQGEISENYHTFLKLAKEKNIAIQVVKKGDKVLLENNLYFDILWPGGEMIGDNILNNNAVVAKLNFKCFSMLFTGDIEGVAEKEIIKENKTSNLCKANILKVRSSWLKNIINTRIY